MGQLALTPEGLVGFAYDPSWLKNGFSISPYFLPLDNRLFVPKDFSFGGLFGVFNDSLPDSWGSFVTDSFLSKQGIQPDSLNPIERLCLLNSKSLGALIYGTGEKKGSANASLDLDSIKKECEVLIQKRDESSIDEIMAFGGSSGGANPKAHGLEICQVSVPQALSAFFITNSFDECLRAMVLAGGDTDTTAAIACSIAEAFYGESDSKLASMALAGFAQDPEAIELLTSASSKKLFHEK